MGLFDLFKKPAPAAAEAKVPSGLLGELIGRCGLERQAPPPESALSGTWWEQPPNDDLLLAFLERGDDVVAFLGEPVEITEIYLVREPSGVFRLGAGSEMDFPELRLPAVSARLARLSPSVKEFQIYENRAGVSLQFAAGVTAETIGQDLDTARAVLRAVER